MKKGLLLGLSMAAAGVAFPQEGVLTETKTSEIENTITIQQDSTSKEVANTLNLFDATGFDGEPETQNNEGNEKKQRFEFHGSAQLGSNWTDLFCSKLGDGPALRLNIDASNPILGIGASATIFSDLDKNVLLFDGYYQKEIGDFSITGILEYVNVDKIPESSSITPIVLCGYYAGKGVTFDACYCHTFQKGIDEDDLRIGVTKTFDKLFSLATQLIYKYNGVHSLSERVEAKIKLTNNISVKAFGALVNGEINRGGGILIAN